MGGVRREHPRGASSGAVASLNLFVRKPGGRWYLIGHHGSPIIR